MALKLALLTFDTVSPIMQEMKTASKCMPRAMGVRGMTTSAHTTAFLMCAKQKQESHQRPRRICLPWCRREGLPSPREICAPIKTKKRHACARFQTMFPSAIGTSGRTGARQKQCPAFKKDSCRRVEFCEWSDNYGCVDEENLCSANAKSARCYRFRVNGVPICKWDRKRDGRATSNRALGTKNATANTYHTANGSSVMVA